MSDVATPRPAGFEWKQVAAAAQPYRPQLITIFLLLLVAGSAWAGSWWGHRQAGTHTVTGLAYSTPFQIGAKAGDWAYAIPLSVPWYGADGAFHEDGRPDCLPPSSQQLPVTFGYAPVTHDGAWWREVVWVDCRH
ncbi:MAG: hypothetical protein JO079_07770 [Frankiaceae bacterium]|nr:hypothetical protein [Frankiaceae bacterium]MBV9369817.1 hypothetical protein [Frankiales bacterium]